MRVKRLGYVATRTSDVEGMTHFLRDALGFGEPGLGEFAWFFVRAPDGRVYAIEQVPD